MKTKIPRFHIVGFMFLGLLAVASPVMAGPEGQPSPDKMMNMPAPSGKFQYAPDFTGFIQPQTLPPWSTAFKLGFGYSYSDRSRGDVDIISDRYSIGDLQIKVGLPKDWEFDLGFNSYRYTDTTVERAVGDEKVKDSFTRDGIGDLNLGFKYNFLGNNGGPWGWGMKIDGLIPTADRNRSEIFQFIETDNTNSDNGRRDRDRDNYGLGISTQLTYDNDHCGLRGGINSGVMLGHPDCCCCDCCCCACFYNSVSLIKDFTPRLALQATFDTMVSTARRSDWRGILSGDLIVRPTPKLQLAVGPYWNVNSRGDNIGGSIELSYLWGPIIRAD